MKGGREISSMYENLSSVSSSVQNLHLSSQSIPGTAEPLLKRANHDSCTASCWLGRASREMALDKSCFVVTSRDCCDKASSRRSTALLFLHTEEDPLNSQLPCTQQGGWLSSEGQVRQCMVLKAFTYRAKSSSYRHFWWWWWRVVRLAGAKGSGREGATELSQLLIWF